MLFVYQQQNDIRRVMIADRRIEVVVNIKDLDVAQGLFGAWMGSTPDGSPLVLLDAGTHDIYALDLDEFRPWKILHERVRFEERGPAVSEEAKKVRARKMIRETAKSRPSRRTAPGSIA